MNAQINNNNRKDNSGNGEYRQITTSRKEFAVQEVEHGKELRQQAAGAACNQQHGD